MKQLLETPAQAAALLAKQNHFLIILHRIPDCDAIGSGYALQLALQSFGKQAMLFCKNDIAPIYREIFQGIHVYHPGDALPFEPRYLVALDTAAPSMFGKGLEAYSALTDLCIDHHATNSCYAKNILLYDHVAANCEILFEVIKALGAAVTPQIATALYCGIATDTGCFKYPNVTPNTLETAAKLLRLGADAKKINYLLFETKSEARIRLEPYVYSHLEYYFDKKCGLTVIPKDLIEECHADDNDLNGLVNLTKASRGVMVAVLLRQLEDAVFKISVRTTEESGIDAGMVCAMLGGGGHSRAAGCTVTADLITAKQMILNAISLQSVIGGVQ